MNILITGGFGFLGFHLANALKDLDCNITLIDLKPVNEFDNDFKDLLESKNISYKVIDLIDQKELDSLSKNYDYIFHFAAILGVDNVINNPDKVLSKNILMLHNLLNFINGFNNKPTLFFASTSEVYAGSLFNSQLEFPTPENSLLILPDLKSPRTSYMLSKIYGEAMCFASNVQSIILRPHNLFGPRMGMKHVIPQLIKKIQNTKKGGSLGVYSPMHQRTFCFIKDAVKQIKMTLLKSSLNDSEIFNLGSQNPEIKMIDLAKKLTNIVGRKDIKVIKLENTLGSPTRRCPSTIKLDDITGISERTNLDLGLRETYEWYINHKREYLD